MLLSFQERPVLSFLSAEGWGRLAIDNFSHGQPISLHWLRCNPFAVAFYSFMGHFLASTNTREGWRASTGE
jgi:hypothetical protein